MYKLPPLWDFDIRTQNRTLRLNSLRHPYDISELQNLTSEKDYSYDVENTVDIIEGIGLKVC